MSEPGGIIPRDRLEALTDGVFAFAMTLLVLNLEIPDGFRPTNSGELLAEFYALGGGLVVYVLSFVVLGAFWFGQASSRNGPEMASGAHMWAVLSLLFFTTVMPFSTQVVGRYNLAPAVWLYAANMILLCLSALAISFIAEKETGVRPANSGRVDLGLLMAAALLSVVISLFSSDGPMLAYLLNFAKPVVRRVLGRD